MKKIFIASLAFVFIQCNTPEPTTTEPGTDTSTMMNQDTSGMMTDTTMHRTDTSGARDTMMPQ